MSQKEEIYCLLADWVFPVPRATLSLRYHSKVLLGGEIIIIFHFSGNRFCCDMPSASIRHLVMSHLSSILWLIQTPTVEMISFK